MMRELVYYVAVSADGFIADRGGDFSAFPQDPATLAALFEMYPETCPTQAQAVLGIDAEPRRFDTVLMGYNTYAPALEAGLPSGAYPHLRQIVVTHRDVAALETISGDVRAAVQRLKEEPGGDIWLCGGGNLAAQVVGLIDEIQVKINPVLFGSGIPLLPHSGTPRHFSLTATTALPGGVVLNTYRRGTQGGCSSQQLSLSDMVAKQ